MYIKSPNHYIQDSVDTTSIVPNFHKANLFLKQKKKKKQFNSAQ